MNFLMLYITYPNEETARQIADELITRKLVAGVNVFPISSMYWWLGKVQREGEYVTIMQSRKALKSRLEEVIRELHPYQVPCIISWEVSANVDYEDWVEKEAIGEI